VLFSQGKVAQVDSMLGGLQMRFKTIALRTGPVLYGLRPVKNDLLYRFDSAIRIRTPGYFGTP
jgi:hypothetical protein